MDNILDLMKLCFLFILIAGAGLIYHYHDFDTNISTIPPIVTGAYIGVIIGIMMSILLILLNYLISFYRVSRGVKT